MEINRFSDRNIKLLIEIYKRGSLTSANQNIYGGIGFYGAKDFLMKKGMITEDGVNERNQKIFILTDKGKKFIQLFTEIEGMLIDGEVPQMILEQPKKVKK